MSDISDAALAELQGVRDEIAKLWAQTQDALNVEPISDIVTVTLDGDGYIQQLYIDPTAPTSLTHVELEDLITDVLRDAYRQTAEQTRNALRVLLATVDWLSATDELRGGRSL